MTDSTPANGGARRLARVLPVLTWLPHYDRRSLRPDTIAGLTVWALLVPEALAYAAIAGVPVQYGLYAAPLALVGYVLFGSSRDLFIGPSATVAAMSAVVVGGVAASGATQSTYVALTAALALLVGALYIVLGLLRAGFIARFFAKPMLAGFIIGLGLYILIGQLPKLMGIAKPNGNTVQVLLETVEQIGDWQWTSVGLGIAALAVLFALPRYAPRVPGALAVAVLAILAATAFDLDGHGVALVGDIPTGYDFVSWSGVRLDDVYDLIPGALAIIVVGYAQSVAIAKEYAARKHYAVDANQELIAYGAANLGAGALQGFTVTGSLAKSAAADQAGGRSPVLLLVAAALVVLTSLVLAGLFERLPEPVLAAIVIHAVAGMIDVSKLARLWRAAPAEFWLAAGALLGVVVFSILAGVVIGVALSFMLLIHRLDHPHIAQLGVRPDGRTFADAERALDAAPVPGALIVRFEAPLMFANAEIFADDLRARIASSSPPPAVLILDMQAVSEVDTTGADGLAQLSAELDGLGMRLLLARTNGSVRDFLRRAGAVRDGDHVFFATVHDALDAAGLDGASRRDGTEPPVPTPAG